MKAYVNKFCSKLLIGSTYGDDNPTGGSGKCRQTDISVTILKFQRRGKSVEVVVQEQSLKQ